MKKVGVELNRMKTPPRYTGRPQLWGFFGENVSGITIVYPDGLTEFRVDDDEDNWIIIMNESQEAGIMQSCYWEEFLGYL
jgi:hypothetical protein